MHRWATRLGCCCFSSFLFALPAQAIEPKDASFFCVAEIAGGLAFRAEQKRWVGAVLNPAEKFVLRLKYLDTQVATGKWDAGRAQSNFEVTIKPSGKNVDRPCNGLVVGDRRTVSIYNDSD
jgi:hypothetical protein